MPARSRNTTRPTLSVLHPVFALTGVVHAVGGPLLPSLASTFHLNDNESGLMFLLYFGGTSLGALFCRGNYARLIVTGFTGMAVCCLGVAMTGRPLLFPLFFLLGVFTGIPMSAVSLLAGRNFPERCAPILTFLNFSWSAGALAAPLLAAQILVHHSYRAAFVLLALLCFAAAVASWLVLEDAPETVRAPRPSGDFTNLRLIVLFALFAFLQVGVENIATAWLSTYALRLGGSGVVLAAAASSLYWLGFLASRGFSSVWLLRVRPGRVLRVAVAVALAGALLLAALPRLAGGTIAMFLLGVALAPIYPLVIAGALARVRRTSDSRFVLATAGFGGSVLPWLAGWISTHTGSLRVGMLVMPAALLLMALLLTTLPEQQTTMAEEARS